MRGFLTRIIDRRLRRLGLGAALGMAVVATTAVATGRFQDLRFDEAQLALEKAQLLVAAAECEPTSGKATRACEKQLKRAQDLLALAREAMIAATAASDGGDVVLPRR